MQTQPDTTHHLYDQVMTDMDTLEEHWPEVADRVRTLLTTPAPHPSTLPECVQAILALLSAQPDARIVTDIGASLTSGWADLRAVSYSPAHKTIILEFS